MASTAVQRSLTRSARPGTLLGTSEHAIWIGTSEDVLVVSDRAAVRLPNAVELAVDNLGRWIEADDPVLVGDGVVRVGLLTAEPRRWFDPRPALDRCSVLDLARNASALPSHPHPFATTRLSRALDNEDGNEVLHESNLLLGRGEGLTPEGDDILAGALASFRLLSESVGGHPGFLDSLEPNLVSLTRSRTTSFSGAMVRHAFHGRVARPFADLLRALTGRGEIISSVERLLSVGNTSGPALVAGLEIGCSAITLENSQ